LPRFLPENRALFFSENALLLGLSTLFSARGTSFAPKMTRAGSHGLLITLLGYGVISAVCGELKDLYPSPRQSYSHWKAYQVMAQDGFACVPINPFPWMVQKECQYLSPALEFGRPLPEEPKQVLLKQLTGYDPDRVILRAIVVPPTCVDHRRGIQVVALAADGRWIATGTKLSRRRSDFPFFAFPDGLQGVHSVALQRENSSAESIRFSHQPILIGSVIPE
jgi:hypothetical protein